MSSYKTNKFLPIKKVKILGHKAFSTDIIFLKFVSIVTLRRYLIFLKTYSTWKHGKKKSRMDGKGENKGTKRRPNTQMEQPEEKCRPWRNWCQSEFLWDPVGFVVGLFFFLTRDQPKPDNKLLHQIKSMHQNMMITKPKNSKSQVRATTIFTMRK